LYGDRPNADAVSVGIAGPIAAAGHGAWGVAALLHLATVAARKKTRGGDRADHCDWFLSAWRS
jgi:hypothetical protein